MGVMSRRVLPYCAAFFCFSCPSLRPSSKKPTKRYKTFLRNVYEKDGSINERTLSKMCDYASHNLDKLVIILAKLETNAISELKSGDQQRLSSTVKIYSKLLASCSEHMFVLAPSVLTLVVEFLDSSNADVHALAFLLFGQFTFCQVDKHYCVEIEKLLPRIISTSAESTGSHGTEGDSNFALQALTASIWYSHSFLYSFSNTTKLLSSILDNYEDSRDSPNEPEEDIKLWVELSQANKNLIKLSAVNRKGTEHPELWQRLSLLGVCQVASDPSFTQFIIVPVLQYLHNGSHWGSSLASNLLTVMHHIMAESGKGEAFFGNLAKFASGEECQMSPQESSSIVKLMTHLAAGSHSQPAVPTPLGPTKYLCSLLVKSFETMRSSAGPGSEPWQSHKELAHSLQMCLSSMASQMSSPQVVLDELAHRLDSLSPDADISEPTVEALFLLISCTAHPLLVNLQSQPKEFPSSLLHHLVQTMTHHPDPSTRAVTHNAFSALLLPPSAPPAYEPPSAASSVHGSQPHFHFRRLLSKAIKDTLHLHRPSSWGSSKSHAQSVLVSGPSPSAKPGLVKLPSSQIHGVLVSAIFLQAKMPDNSVHNYVAMANTLAVVVSLDGGNQELRVKAVQMILSLRAWALDPNSRKESGMSAVRLRSVLTMSTSMLLTVSHKSLFSPASASLKSAKEDQCLTLNEDCTLSVAESAGLDAFLVNAEEEKRIASTMIQRRQAAEEETKAVVRAYLARERTLGNVKDPNLSARVTTPFVAEDSYVLQPPSYGLPLRSMEVFLPEADVNSVGYESPNSDFGEEHEEIESRNRPERLPSVDEILKWDEDDVQENGVADEAAALRLAIEVLDKAEISDNVGTFTPEKKLNGNSFPSPGVKLGAALGVA